MGLRGGAKIPDIIQKSRRGLSRELNICKTEIFWPLCDGNMHHEGFLPSDIMRDVGVKLFKGVVS